MLRRQRPKLMNRVDGEKEDIRQVGGWVIAVEYELLSTGGHMKRRPSHGIDEQGAYEW